MTVEEVLTFHKFLDGSVFSAWIDNRTDLKNTVWPKVKEAKALHFIAYHARGNVKVFGHTGIAIVFDSRDRVNHPPAWVMEELPTELTADASEYVVLRLDYGYTSSKAQSASQASLFDYGVWSASPNPNDATAIERTSYIGSMQVGAVANLNEVLTRQFAKKTYRLVTLMFSKRCTCREFSAAVSKIVERDGTAKSPASTFVADRIKRDKAWHYGTVGSIAVGATGTGAGGGFLIFQAVAGKTVASFAGTVAIYGVAATTPAGWICGGIGLTSLGVGAVMKVVKNLAIDPPTVIQMDSVREEDAETCKLR